MTPTKRDELEAACAAVLHDIEGPWPDHPPGQPVDDRPLREPITDPAQLPPAIQQAIRVREALAAGCCVTGAAK